MKAYLRIVMALILCLTPILSFGQGGTQQDSPVQVNIRLPKPIRNTALNVKWAAGTVANGGHLVAVAAGNTAVTSSKTTCAQPISTTCNIIFVNSSGTVANTSTPSTAFAVGNTVLAYVETSATVITAITYPSVITDTSFLSVGLPTYSCGASLAAAGACANTFLGNSFHVVTGSFLLAGNTSTVTGIAPAFTSATSWWCVANDVTTRANPVQAIPGSGSTVVITNTTGATDLIQMVCMGN